MATDSHDHAHDHQPPPDEDGPLTYYQTMEIAVRELLIEKGVFGRRRCARCDRGDGCPQLRARRRGRGPRLDRPGLQGQRCWRTALGGLCAQLGIDIGPTRLIAVENTEAVHNVIVCTLCSCYPRNLLGLPPDWYKAKAYRSRVVREPRAVLREFGTEVPDDVTVRVHDSTADMRYIVVPRRPAGTEGWDRERLAALVTRDCLIGVTLPKNP